MEKYLRYYAEPGTAAVEGIAPGVNWRRVVVIPVCNESTAILRALPPGPGRSLMIVVVNEAGDAPGNVSAANQEFAAELPLRFRMCWQSTAAGGLSLYRDPGSSRDVLLVDRFSEGRRLPPAGGVGHARKTGADLAAFLIHRRRIRSPWIHCTDADVRLPRRYFSCVPALGENCARDTAALLYPFRHRTGANETDDRIARATRLYEYSLRYYVAGLSYAASPYAFHTIGSTLAINALHYSKVRGFPRRRAGEDFYLLNKLAKVGSVRQLDAKTDCEPIDIAARVSDRVPFGTGAAARKIMELEDPARDFLLYHPAVFEMLRAWLGSLSSFWQARSSDIGAILSPSDLRILIDGLEESGASRALQHALRQSSDAAQFKRQMHTWFDAFRTLKLIHYLRDRHLPSVSVEELFTGLNPGHLLRHEGELAALHETLRGDWFC